MIAFRLARDVGEWDVDAMLLRMSSPLFSEWCEFYAREPMSEGFYIAFAGLATNIARMLGIKNAKIEDYMIRFGKEKRKAKEMSDDDMESVFRAMAMAHNKALKNG